MQPFELSLAEASRAVRARELSPVELTESVLARIAAVEGRLGAYVTVTADAALAAAVRAEREISASGPRGPLHGIPMALKDLIDAEGIPTTASSHVRAGHVAERDSRVAERLGAAGAVLLGKTHTHEFAYGLTTPQTNNAWDHSRVAGGSSGGSAVAVAAGAATFAMGTDTGGSIRVPAALNGVVGLKPTYGLVPRTGVTSLSWSLDHVGPLARTVQDVALVLSATAGHDPRDPASVSGPMPARLPGGDLRGLKVGVPRNHYFDRVAPEVEASVRGAVERLAELGAELVDVEIPMARYIQAAQWGLMVPEATAYHERSLRATPDLYAADVRILLEAGALTSAGDYLRAQRARTMMRDAWARMFDGIDVLAAPTVPMTAAEAGQEAVEWADGTTEAVSDSYVRLCAPANITGVPALSLPVGHDRAGLPIGMQLMARPFHDATVLRVGRVYEESVAGAGRLAPLAA
ncbi:MULTISPECIES: Asp-tRNA(Asn)/Glu-tRNA(Gln) amidotransferase GatCAB subunit A [Streptomyces]|uniref:Asp-tRNA(Asn)/Glu-tRNA(Gln) amidotransferase GatCAB subunit A n=1 Tax=Streptomyces TaxID=1883 RepID=UPI0004C7043B|nr:MULTISPECIES: Asp-tRNA(Asn)/Glu-tRNA(Gln) amidotransferase GatCAB subunit A [Streptomyces]MDX2917971.1 Asp-tRNA(Asn)/Glu-tRNA(Gln) amidotransferase GatCAB subunit A [Streptomyces sp. NE06-03C]MDX3606064.1 Asp-tRNA(Asn)/Glu-tRNA(Gln) amidotransferase GatCAB subunit A [Streptomyces sp. FL06-04B]MDX3734020.1 Asp-tRNA(Asn)/Glu-tRNA(Gln) amidotransferase GatCAB subunit A [Streptomyces sp. ID01-15D]